MKNWGLDQIGFTVVPTLIFDMTKAKALYLPYSSLFFPIACTAEKGGRPEIFNRGRVINSVDSPLYKEYRSNLMVNDKFARPLTLEFTEFIYRKAKVFRIFG